MRILLNALSQADLQRFIDALNAQVESNEAEREALRPLSWDMVAEMHRAGLAIGSHTRTHPLLPNEAAPKVLDEIAGSREHLESRLGAPVRHFAYPNGWFNAATVRAVAASGYRCGYTTCGHRDPNNPFLTISRKCLWENSCFNALGRFSEGIMSSHVHGIFDLVSKCQQDHREPNLDRPGSDA
jgi:peptidoglycan/xylan/chitin deacetylase (PgdA/CDA1 family)